MTRCPRCGAVIESGDPADLCAECLFLGALESAETGPMERGVSISAEDLNSAKDLNEDRFGSYRLLRLIAVGGMGAVYLAEQTHLIHRQVAVKVVKLGMDTKQVLARFESERQALALMDHPNIARVFEAGTSEKGRPFFAMEYVDGLPITEYCDRRMMTTQGRLELFLPVCQAVQHAHQKGVIHRDVKPSNILVALQDGKPIPKVIDFGIAKAIDQRLAEHTCFTQLGQFIGTPEYMSPEQADLASNDVDTRADVYSLGVVLYELLVGALPFDIVSLRRAGAAEWLRVIQEEDAPTLTSKLTQLGAGAAKISTRRGTSSAALRRELAGDLDWIVVKALEKDRQRRYSSVSELAADIERHLDDHPVIASPPGRIYRTRKFAARHKAGIFAAAAVLLVLIGGIVASTMEAWRATKAERTALGEKERADAEAGIAKATSDFLTGDLLGSANMESESSNGPDLKVRAVLDRAAARIQGKFAGRPEVEAAIRDVIGTAYKSLGLYSEAQIHLEKAVELYRGLPKPSPGIVSSLENLSDLHLQLGKYSLAEKTAAEAVSLSTALAGPNDSATLSAMENMATAQQIGGKDDAAERIYQRILDAGKQSNRDESLLLEVKTSLGLIYRNQRRLFEAESMLADVVENQRRVAGDRWFYTLVAKNNLALVYEYEGRLKDSEASLSQVLEAAKQLLGPAHPNTLKTMCSLGRIYKEEGRYKEAESMLTSAQALRKTLWPDNPDSLRVLAELASLRHAEGRDRDAAVMYQKVMGEEKSGAGEVPVWFDDYAKLYEDEHDYAKASQIYEQVLEARLHKFGRDKPITALAMESVGRVRLEQKRFGEAASLLQQSWTIWEKSQPQAIDRYETQSLLGAALSAQGKYGEAEPLLLSAYEQLQKISAAFGWPVPAGGDRIVELYARWQKPEKAMEWRRMAGRAHTPAQQLGFVSTPNLPR
jgi:non-specific serine/threonine protein kinase/serine/threonine-protein kinase